MLVTGEKYIIDIEVSKLPEAEAFGFSFTWKKKISM